MKAPTTDLRGRGGVPTLPRLSGAVGAFDDRLPPPLLGPVKTLGCMADTDTKGRQGPSTKGYTREGTMDNEIQAHIPTLTYDEESAIHEYVVHAYKVLRGRGVDNLDSTMQLAFMYMRHELERRRVDNGMLQAVENFLSHHTVDHTDVGDRDDI